MKRDGWCCDVIWESTRLRLRTPTLKQAFEQEKLIEKREDERRQTKDRGRSETKRSRLYSMTSVPFFDYHVKLRNCVYCITIDIYLYIKDVRDVVFHATCARLSELDAESGRPTTPFLGNEKNRFQESRSSSSHRANSETIQGTTRRDFGELGFSLLKYIFVLLSYSCYIHNPKFSYN